MVDLVSQQGAIEPFPQNVALPGHRNATLRSPQAQTASPLPPNRASHSPKKLPPRRGGTSAQALVVSLAVHGLLIGAFVAVRMATSTPEGTPPEPVFAVKMAPASSAPAAPKLGQATLEQRVRVQSNQVRPAPVVSVQTPSVSFPTTNFSLSPSPNSAQLPSRGEFSESGLSLLASATGDGAGETVSPGGSGPSQIGAEGAAGYLGKPRLEYPASARRLSMEGRCVLKLTIGPDGELQDLVVTVSSGHKVLDEAALRCAREARYYAAKVGEERVRSVVEWPFVFKLAP